MILSAVYIEEHYLFKEPQIINLGGRFNYSIESNLILKKEDRSNLLHDIQLAPVWIKKIMQKSLK